MLEYNTYIEVFLKATHSFKSAPINHTGHRVSCPSKVTRYVRSLFFYLSYKIHIHDQFLSITSTLFGMYQLKLLNTNIRITFALVSIDYVHTMWQNQNKPTFHKCLLGFSQASEFHFLFLFLNMSSTLFFHSLSKFIRLWYCFFLFMKNVYLWYHLSWNDFNLCSSEDSLKLMASLSLAQS